MTGYFTVDKDEWDTLIRERDEAEARAVAAEAETTRLRQRTHELQERHDKAYAEMKRTAEAWQRDAEHTSTLYLDKFAEWETLRVELATQIKKNHKLLQRNTTIREERDQAQADLTAAQERERAYINLLTRIAAGIGAEPEGFGYHAKHGLDVVRELFEIADAFVAAGREEQSDG